MRLAWARAQALAERAGEGSPSWQDAVDLGRVDLDPGEDGAWLDLGKALLGSQGLAARLDGLDRLSALDAQAGLSRFEPWYNEA